MSVALRRSSLPVAALLAVYACSIATLRSSWFAEDPTVFSAAIAFDLTITASLLVWWLGVRLVLSEPIGIRGPFGITRRREVIAITVDEPERFVSAVT